MAIYSADFWFFIIVFTMRNPNLGLPTLGDELFANSLIFNHLTNLSCVWVAFKVRLKCESEAADHGGEVRYG